MFMRSLALLNICLLIATMMSAFASPTNSQSEFKHSAITQVVLLGTGTPGPDPRRSGPATLIVVNELRT